jgi:hypothetical protein
MAAHSPTPSGHRAPRWLVPERDLRSLYYKHFGERRKERQLFSTGALRYVLGKGFFAELLRDAG